MNLDELGAAHCSALHGMVHCMAEFGGGDFATIAWYHLFLLLY